MLYVVEGHDGVGKTTVAQLLAKRAEGVYLKYDPAYQHNDFVDDILVSQVLGLTLHPETIVVSDRSILSGLAYSSVLDMRGRAMAWRKWLSNLFGIRVVIVHLVAPRSVRMERDPYAKQPAVDIDILAKQLCAYEGKVWYVAYDTSERTPEQIVDHLLLLRA